MSILEVVSIISCIFVILTYVDRRNKKDDQWKKRLLYVWVVTFYIRLQLGIRLHYKSKSNIYSKLIVVNVADGWSERLRSSMGRSKERLSEVSQAITERQAKREKSGGLFPPWKSWTARSRHSARTTGTALWSMPRCTAGRAFASLSRTG